jgi:hypothetical protein
MRTIRGSVDFPGRLSSASTARRGGLLIDVASGQILRTADEIGFDGHQIRGAVPMHRNRIALTSHDGPFRVGGGGPKARQPTMVDRESTTTRL